MGEEIAEQLEFKPAQVRVILWCVARRQPDLFIRRRAYGQAGGRAIGAV